MIILDLTTGQRSYDPLHHKSKAPRFRWKHFQGLTVRDSLLEIVRTKFKGLPDFSGATEVYYPGEIGIFVYTNLIFYLKQRKAEPIRKQSEREKYMSKIQN